MWPAPPLIAAELGHGVAPLVVAAQVWTGDVPYVALVACVMLAALFTGR
ncbi:hypothetical protein [Streptomyces sp. NPDC057702]